MIPGFFVLPIFISNTKNNFTRTNFISHYDDIFLSSSNRRPGCEVQTLMRMLRMFVADTKKKNGTFCEKCKWRQKCNGRSQSSVGSPFQTAAKQF